MNDDYITLAQAAKLAPGRPHGSVVWRWCRNGIKARNGERVHLEHVRMGGRIFTTAKALEEFGQALAQADMEHFDRPPPPSRRHLMGCGPHRRKQQEARRQRELEEAERQVQEILYGKKGKPKR